MGYLTYQHARITDIGSNKAVLESYVSLSEDPKKTDGSLQEKLSDMLLGQPNVSRAEFVSRAPSLMTK
jgi:hypothetical protein